MGNAKNENLFYKFYDMAGKRVAGIPDPPKSLAVTGESGKPGTGINHNPEPVASDGSSAAGQTGHVSRAGSTEPPANKMQSWSIAKAGNAIQTGNSEQSGKAMQSGESGKPETKEDGFKLDFSSNSIVNSFLLSEVLGRPKCFQKRRW